MGLASDAGQSLNHQPAILVAWDAELNRWKCRVQNNARANLSGIKESNLMRLERRPLPTSNHRGITMATHSPWEKAVTLSDLLVRSTSTYSPPETMLMGEAGMAFMRLGQYNFVACASDQMEHLAGVLALYGMCREGKHEAVLFALLEADPMALEILINTMACAPWIGPEEEAHVVDELHQFYETDFTPDQQEGVYIQTMLNGPVGLLNEMVDNTYGKALFPALARCSNSNLFVRRLLRWMAREGMEEPDGLKLGKVARRLCEEILEVHGKIPLLTRAEGKRILRSSVSMCIDAAREFVLNVLIDKYEPENESE